MRERSSISVVDALGALAGALAAGAAALLLWGFTVDDALVTARMAHHLAAGVGYRYNPGGAVTDAVTPLGWAHVLSPFADEGSLGAFEAARLLGLAAWLASGAFVGFNIARLGKRRSRWWALGLLAISAPLGAWSGAGMETALVMALATFAFVPGPPGALLAGLAAAWRPELIPWAVVFSGLSSALKSQRHGALSVAISLALATAPAVAVALLRWLVFGDPAPLAVYAKPSDLGHGAWYTAAAAIWTAIPVCVVAPRAFVRVAPVHRAAMVAMLVHLLAMTLAGGDWMPLFRLLVPILPGLALVAAAVIEHSPAWATAVRLSIAYVLGTSQVVVNGDEYRGVVADRMALIARARPALAIYRSIAALDIGWVGIAAPRANIIDLAGITDRRVALLSGGHTSKKIYPSLVASVDAAVLLGRPRGASFGTWSYGSAVEARTAHLLAEQQAYSPAARIEVPWGEGSYVVLERDMFYSLNETRPRFDEPLMLHLR